MSCTSRMAASFPRQRKRNGSHTKRPTATNGSKISAKDRATESRAKIGPDSTTTPKPTRARSSSLRITSAGGCRLFTAETRSEGEKDNEPGGPGKRASTEVFANGPEILWPFLTKV